MTQCSETWNDVSRSGKSVGIEPIPSPNGPIFIAVEQCSSPALLKLVWLLAHLKMYEFIVKYFKFCSYYALMKTQPLRPCLTCADGLKKFEHGSSSACQMDPLNNCKVSLHPESISPNILPESREISLNKCRVS